MTIIPENYTMKLPLRETEVAIKKLKDYFEQALAKELHLLRVSAPIFVRPESGLNDNLNGIERPVDFDVPAIAGNRCEIVHSLAKWKRMALKRYGFQVGEGLYTDMNAIRRDEVLDNLHSIYVDQWDWEKIIQKHARNRETLVDIVQRIYAVFRRTGEYIVGEYPFLTNVLPEEITFVSAQELEDRYPELTPQQRETAMTREKKAVFVEQVGGLLRSGARHDGRAPDYDDWTLNGDILFWYPQLDAAVEVSSMGIRVDEESLMTQLAAMGWEAQMECSFHQELANGRLPYTIGGGIGQSRLCMFFLEKIHIGEVQASVWPDDVLQECAEHQIELL